MSISKKKLSIFALAIAAVMLIGMIAAYFTDTDEAENVFTMGSVDIRLIESQLHRVNAGTTAAGRLSTDQIPMEGQAGTAPEDAYGWDKAYFTDDQIKADAEHYQDEYLATLGRGMLPGDNVMKAPYVINEGASDAYIRVRVLIPAELDNGILTNSMYTGTVLSNGAATLKVTNNKEVNGIVYNEYAFTYTDPIAPGQMTFWNVWGDVKVSESMTMEDLARLIEGGFLSDGGQFSILVQADGIQARHFDTAAEAFAAFDAQ